MKMRSLIKTTFLLLALLLPATATAQFFEVDGIYYSINDDQVSVSVTYLKNSDGSSASSYSGDITIPETVNYLGTTYTVVSIGSWTFKGCTGLTSVTIPGSVTYIGGSAFEGCSGLTNATIGNSVTVIYDYAFRGCSGLTSIALPSSLRYIGNDSFIGCSGLTSITIPDSVTHIGVYAFSFCSNLASTIVIPASVISIGEGLFHYCTALPGIIVDSENPTYDSRNDCNAIIETSSNKLIAGCKSTVIPNTVKALGYGAFSGCTGLKNINIPNSVTHIGDFAFSLCEGLTGIAIPSSVTYIGGGAFYNCSGLADVYSHIADPSAISMGNVVFYQDPENYSSRTLHVPEGTVDAYQDDLRWSRFFGQIVEMEPETVLIGDVNGDGEVNLADINAIVDIILGGNGDSAAADVNDDGEINIGDLNAIINIIQTTETGDDKHEWVDLGLPSGTLWAAYNVGADAPEEYGDYFAWGETEPKEVYDWSTYKWCNGTHDSLTKYCSTSGYGVLDYKNELECEDDAAYVNWGPLWCMPTHEQQVELMNVCTWTQTTLNGVNGYQVTGPNGNILFFPYTGERSGSQLMYAGSSAGYWPRTLFAADAGQIMYLRWNEVRTAWTYRCMGYTVRAVRSQQLIVEQQNFDFGEVPIGQTRRGELTIVNNTTKAQTLTVCADEPFLLERGEGSASSITVVVPSNSSGTVKVVYTATEPGEFNGDVTFQSPAFDGGERVIPVQAFAYSDNVPEHRCVDLGLPSGTLWATCNVGASAPEELGDYFAWGETEPKDDYSWTTYKWCNGSDHTLTKYCTYDYFGTVDNLTVLYPEDDAATVNWGSSWCMPTKEQFLELSSHCSKIWTTRNGVTGYLYIGPNGNTLFLPATGKRMGNSHQESGTRGYYWSRSLVENITYSAWCLNFGSDYMQSSSNSRNLGITVRAVRMSQE